MSKITLEISHQDSTPIHEIESFDLPIPRKGEHFEIYKDDEDNNEQNNPTYVVCGVYHCFAERKVILWVRTYAEYTDMVNKGDNPLKY